MIPSYRIDHLRKILGHLYDFEAFLGRGAFAEVLRVRHRRLGRQEALKILLEAHDGSSNFASRFVEEAKLVASLDHPNIVKVYDYGEIEGVLWYSMQYVDGVTLRAEIDHRPLFSEQEVISLAVPLLDALENSHAAGIVHRDVKPGNIMVSRRGRPYLMDFGIAKVKDSGLRTQTGSVLGTPAYISPEQASGESVDGRSDVYSLAICLYQLLTGHLPFPGDDPIQMLLRRLKGNPLPPSDHRPEVDPELESIILKALQKKPQDRFQSAAEMRRQLTGDFRAKIETQAIALTVKIGAPQTLPPRNPIFDTDTWPAGTGTNGTAAASKPPESTEAPTLVTAGPLDVPEEAVQAKTESTAPASWIIGLLASIILVLLGTLAWQAQRNELFVPEEGPPVDGSISQPAPPVQADPATPTVVVALPNDGLEPPHRSATPSTETTEATPSPKAPSEPSSKPGAQTVHSPSPTKPPPPLSPAVRPAVVPPKLLERAALEMDETLLGACDGGMVILTLRLDAHGKVTSTQVLKSPDPQCSEIASDVFKRSRFQPGRDFEGQPTESSLSLSLQLRLH